MMISNKAELDKCREAAVEELQSYGCRILVLPQVPRRSIRR